MLYPNKIANSQTNTHANRLYQMNTAHQGSKANWLVQEKRAYRATSVRALRHKTEGNNGKCTSNHLHPCLGRMMVVRRWKSDLLETRLGHIRERCENEKEASRKTDVHWCVRDGLLYACALANENAGQVNGQVTIKTPATRPHKNGAVVMLHALLAGRVKPGQTTLTSRAAPSHRGSGP